MQIINIRSDKYRCAEDSGFNESDHPRDEDGKFSKAASQIHEVIKNHGNTGHYGLRIDESDGPHAKLNIGEKVPVSRQWKNGDPTNKKLIGSSAVRLKDTSIEGIEKTLRQMQLHQIDENSFSPYYFGDIVHLINSKLAPHKGADLGEGVFKDADLVGRWKKTGPGRKEIQANDNINRHGLAFDRNSVRSKDANGHLIVELANISIADVNPYYGHEIPDADALGLDPQRVYMLLRDPEELKKAASTFNEKPLLLRHKPVSADDHPREITVGTIGSNAEFVHPHLQNSLTVWDQEGIDAIESEETKELSPGYRYRADMTPGTFEGKHYDGVMRDLAGNHLALVVEGRSGPTVVVGDSALKENPMPNNKLSLKGAVAKGALVAYLRPKLAQDAKIDLTPALKGVTAKGWKAGKAKLAADVQSIVKGKLAKDADLGDLSQILDMLDGEGEPGAGEDEEIPDNAAALDDEGMHSEVDEETLWRGLQKLIAKMLGDENQAADTEEEKPALDNPPPSPATPEPGKPPAITKAAMDAALAKTAKETREQVMREINAISEARVDVAPVVGTLTQAFDSAEAIYKFALDQAKVDLTGVPASAYRALFKAHQGVSAKAAKPTHIAVDHAAVSAAVADLGALGEVTLS